MIEHVEAAGFNLPTIDSSSAKDTLFLAIILFKSLTHLLNFYEGEPW